MESPCAQISKLHTHGRVKSGECVNSGNKMDDCHISPLDVLNSSLEEVSDEEMDEGDISQLSALNSSLEEVSDEEISTKKERHWRLGPEDLNDTLPCDFAEFEN